MCLGAMKGVHTYEVMRYNVLIIRAWHAAFVYSLVYMLRIKA